MQEVLLDYGDTRMRAELPDHAVVVRYGKTYNDPPTVDAVEATRQALAAPLGMPPLRQLGGPGKKVVIGFPDRVRIDGDYRIEPVLVHRDADEVLLNETARGELSALHRCLHLRDAGLNHGKGLLLGRNQDGRNNEQRKGGQVLHGRLLNHP